MSTNLYQQALQTEQAVETRKTLDLVRQVADKVAEILECETVAQVPLSSLDRTVAQR